jgi:CRISPR system Cascade subunit CasC
MDRFLQLHILTPYMPSNLNRDDLGKPKSALVGGADRTRISSQCLKRSWRKSDVFSIALGGSIGTRTRNIRDIITNELVDIGVDENDIKKLTDEWINKIYNGDKKGKEKISKKNPETNEETLAKKEKSEIIHLSPNEIENIKKLIREGRPINEIKQEEILFQREQNEAVDIALFGRMIAKTIGFNVEAAMQVANAITTHKVLSEVDYFTAADDLSETSAGAFIGESNFSSGVFYEYICLNRDLLLKNLRGDIDLADKTVRAIIEAIMTVSPSGKQNSYASLCRSVYVLAEIGNQSPRNLGQAYFHPVRDDNLTTGSIDALIKWRDKTDQMYGDAWSENYEFNLIEQKGNLKELKDFVGIIRNEFGVK